MECTTGTTRTGGRHLSTTYGCNPQPGHNDVSVQDGSFSGLLSILNCADAEMLCVCNAYLHCALYTNAEKQKQEDMLKMDAFTLPQFSIFMSNSYVQHERVQYLGYGNLRYYVSLISCL